MKYVLLLSTLQVTIMGLIKDKCFLTVVRQGSDTIEIETSVVQF